MFWRLPRLRRSLTPAPSEAATDSMTACSLRDVVMVAVSCVEGSGGVLLAGSDARMERTGSREPLAPRVERPVACAARNEQQEAAGDRDVLEAA